MDWLTSEQTGELASGVVLTIAITIATSLIALPLGIVVGTLRGSGPQWARRLAGVYVEVFRNIPALIQIIFWVFAFPNLFPNQLRREIFFKNPVMDAVGSLTGLPIPYYLLAACFALVLNTSGHLGELFRSGVSSIPTELIDSARTLGANRRRVFWSVLLPGGMRAAFPAISTRLIHNMKNTALVSFASIPDLFHRSQAAIEETFRATEFLVLAAVLYLMLATAFTAILRFVDQILHRGQHPRQLRVGPDRPSVLSGLGSFRSIKADGTT